MFTASGREIHFCSHAFPAGGQNACQRVPSQNWEKATATRPVPEPRRLRALSPQRFGQRSTHQAHDRQACQHDRAAPLAVSRGKPISLSPPMSVSGPPSLEGTSAKRGVPDSSVISDVSLATLNRYRSLGYPRRRPDHGPQRLPDRQVAQGGGREVPAAGKKGDSPHLCEAPFGPFRRAPTAGWSGTVPFFTVGQDAAEQHFDTLRQALRGQRNKPGSVANRFRCDRHPFDRHLEQLISTRQTQRTLAGAARLQVERRRAVATVVGTPNHDNVGQPNEAGAAFGKCLL